MQQAAPVTIDPTLSLDLRLRWLEAILLGVKQDTRDKKGKEREKPHELNSGETLFRVAEDLQRRLDAIVEGNEALKRFVDHCSSRHSVVDVTSLTRAYVYSSDDQHAHLLTPAFALSGLLPDPPSYDNMSPEQLEALLAEMEPDIRAADRDMHEIELLEQKGVTGAGKLAGMCKMSHLRSLLIPPQIMRLYDHDWTRCSRRTRGT